LTTAAVGFVVVGAWLLGGFEPSGYEISDVRVVRAKGPIGPSPDADLQEQFDLPPGGTETGWKVRFHASWRGRGKPPPRSQLCELEIFDSEGRVLKTDGFGLNVGKEANTRAPGLYTEADLRGEPSGANVTCES